MLAIFIRVYELILLALTAFTIFHIAIYLSDRSNKNNTNKVVLLSKITFILCTIDIILLAIAHASLYRQVIRAIIWLIVYFTIGVKADRKKTN